MTRIATSSIYDTTDRGVRLHAELIVEKRGRHWCVILRDTIEEQVWGYRSRRTALDTYTDMVTHVSRLHELRLGRRRHVWDKTDVIGIPDNTSTFLNNPGMSSYY